MYGSAGAFLSPENLVGRSGAKFPPDAAALSGLFFHVKALKPSIFPDDLRYKLFVAGPFWSEIDNSPEDFYVPLPRHKVIGKNTSDEWTMRSHKWCLQSQVNDEATEENNQVEKVEEIEADYHWLRIDYWDDNPETIRQDAHEASPSVAEKSWEYVSILHPRMKNSERHVLEKNGLFLENAVQMKDGACLVYLSTHKLPDGWYRFGGESHIVEISSVELSEDSSVLKRLREPIKRACALITPGIWGSNKLSYRYPKHSDFPKAHNKIKMLTERAVPYRYRAGSRMGRGRYAVPSGSVYVFNEPLNRSWWDFPEDWFPKEGFSLKHVGVSLCLPIKVQGVDE